MKSELLLREDVYNKHFKNGGAGAFWWPNSSRHLASLLDTQQSGMLLNGSSTCCPSVPAGDKVLNVGSAKHAEAGLMGWMLNRKSLDLPAAPGARPSVSRGGSRELGTPAKKL